MLAGKNSKNVVVKNMQKIFKSWLIETSWISSQSWNECLRVCLKKKNSSTIGSLKTVWLQGTFTWYLYSIQTPQNHTQLTISKIISGMTWGMKTNIQMFFPKWSPLEQLQSCCLGVLKNAYFIAIPKKVPNWFSIYSIPIACCWGDGSSLENHPN